MYDPSFDPAYHSACVGTQEAQKLFTHTFLFAFCDAPIRHSRASTMQTALSDGLASLWHKPLTATKNLVREFGEREGGRLVAVQS